MSAYSRALSRPVGLVDSPYTRAYRGLSQMSEGMARGRSAGSLYKRGAGLAVPEPEVVIAGAMDSLEGFIVDIAHILLLVGGLWLFISAFR